MSAIADFCEALLDREPTLLRLHDEPGAMLISSVPIEDAKHLCRLNVVELRSAEDEEKNGKPLATITVPSLLIARQLLIDLHRIVYLSIDKRYMRHRDMPPVSRIQTLCDRAASMR